MRRSLSVLPVVTIAAAMIGAATSLALSSDTIGAATTAAGRCATAGLSVVQTVPTTLVTTVTVGILPAACAGGILRVAVHNGITSSEGTATIPGGGGTVTVTLAVAVAVTVAEQTDVVVSGP